MIDRFGKTINVGWADHELLWLHAAIELPLASERSAAYRDLVFYTTRTYAEIYSKGERLLTAVNAAKRGARLSAPAPSKVTMALPADFLPVSKGTTSLGMMGARAPVRA